MLKHIYFPRYRGVRGGGRVGGRMLRRAAPHPDGAAHGRGEVRARVGLHDRHVLAHLHPRAARCGYGRVAMPRFD